MTGQRRRFGGDTLHQAAITAQGKNVVRNQVMPGTIEVSRQPALGKRHADTGGHALAKRPGGGFNAGRQTMVRRVLRMTGAFAVQLAEVHQIFKWQIKAVDMQGAIQ